MLQEWAMMRMATLYTFGMEKSDTLPKSVMRMSPKITKKGDDNTATKAKGTTDTTTPRSRSKVKKKETGTNSVAAASNDDWDETEDGKKECAHNAVAHILCSRTQARVSDHFMFHIKHACKDQTHELVKTINTEWCSWGNGQRWTYFAKQPFSLMSKRYRIASMCIPTLTLLLLIRWDISKTMGVIGPLQTKWICQYCEPSKCCQQASSCF